jgi:hypothetical protein
MTMHAAFRPVALARGDVLRIRDGGGLMLRPTSGVLWVTEERNPDDRVIAPGDVCRLEGMGLALVYAHRNSRIVIDVPPSIERLPDVRLALHGADEARRVPLDLPVPTGLVGKVRALWRRIGRDSERSSAPEAAVGGRYEHDAFLSSRRKRGVAERFDADERDPLHRPWVPLY